MHRTKIRRKLVHGLLLAGLALLLSACGAEEDAADDGGVVGQVGLSVYGSTRSHNTGEDCKQCHKPGGLGEGVFTLAGTVYSGGSPAANTTVYIYADQNYNNLALTLEVDGNGNFYTVADVPGLVLNDSGFVDGVFVEVKGADGQTRSMSGRISTGSSSCNSCHSPNGTQSRIQ